MENYDVFFTIETQVVTNRGHGIEGVADAEVVGTSYDLDMACQKHRKQILGKKPVRFLEIKSRVLAINLEMYHQYDDGELEHVQNIITGYYEQD